MERRLGALNRQSRLIVARYATLAAAKLVQLTESNNAEIARKAYLDIISLGMQGSPGRAADDEPAQDDSEQVLSPEMAGRLLAALAEQQPGD